MSPLFNRKLAYLHRVRSQQRNKMLNDFGCGVTTCIKLGRFLPENDLTPRFQKKIKISSKPVYQLTKFYISLYTQN